MSEVEIAAKPTKQRWYRSLFVQVLIGIALGIATGILFPEFSITWRRWVRASSS